MRKSDVYEPYHTNNAHDDIHYINIGTKYLATCYVGAIEETMGPRGI